jgi:hypothetical protein
MERMTNQRLTASIRRTVAATTLMTMTARDVRLVSIATLGRRGSMTTVRIEISAPQSSRLFEGALAHCG